MGLKKINKNQMTDSLKKTKNITDFTFEKLLI